MTPGKVRLHLDLRPDDQDAEVARLEQLGATRVDIGQGPDVSWVVMADPGGNEFCVLRRASRAGRAYGLITPSRRTDRCTAAHRRRSSDCSRASERRAIQAASRWSLRQDSSRRSGSSPSSTASRTAQPGSES